MTDLISALADSIIALINAKPGSPTKEEVDAVLRLPIETCIDAHKLSSYPRRTPPPRRSPLDAITAEWLMALQLNQRTRAEVDAANERVRRVLLGDCQGEAPGAITWVNDPAALRDQPKVAANYSEAWRIAAQMPTHSEATSKAALRCPGSTDGKHAYSYYIVDDDYRCPCGAKVDAHTLKAINIKP